MQDLLAGQIDLLFSGPEQLPLMRAGSVKAYAVSSDVRLASEAYPVDSGSSICSRRGARAGRRVCEDCLA